MVRSFSRLAVSEITLADRRVFTGFVRDITAQGSRGGDAGT